MGKAIFFFHVLDLWGNKWYNKLNSFEKIDYLYRDFKYGKENEKETKVEKISSPYRLGFGLLRAVSVHAH